MKQKMIVVLFVLTIAILVSGCVKISEYQPGIVQNQTDVNQNETALSCDKEANCCLVDEDCQYIWYTGGCNTPEYVAKKLKEAQEKGIYIGEAPLRENVTCTCENDKCVTHN